MDSDDDDFDDVGDDVIGGSDAAVTSSLSVRVGATEVSVSEVTDEMVARMTAVEKQQYIRAAQRLYEQLNH